jgi:hypothetical protein
MVEIVSLVGPRGASSTQASRHPGHFNFDVGAQSGVSAAAQQATVEDNILKTNPPPS